MGLIYDQLVEDYGAVTYEAFINLLVSKLHEHLVLSLIPDQVEITEDQTSPAQLRESFRGIANDKVRLFFTLFFATAHSLRNHSLLSQSWTSVLRIFHRAVSITYVR